MDASHSVHDVLHYGLTVSALMFALVLWGYSRAGQGRGFVFMALSATSASVSDALQMILPSSEFLSLLVAMEMVLRGSFLLLACQFFIGYVWPWATFLLSAVLVLTVVSSKSDGVFQMLLPGSLLSALGYVGCAIYCWAARDRSHPVGFFGAALSMMLLGIVWLLHPWLFNSELSPWGLASVQVLYLICSGSLILALYLSQRLRADFVSELQEEALLKAMHNRRRVIQMREWTDILLKQMTDGVIVIDMKGVVTGFNRAAEGIMGYKASEVLGQSYLIFIPERFRPDDENEALENLLEYAHRRASPREFIALHAKGYELEAEMVISMMVMDEAEQIVGVIRDVSERKRQQTQLNFMAKHDSLTKLPNRHYFEETVEKKMAQHKGGFFAFIDLDDFKLLNDTYGHKAGDTALIAMSRRLQSVAGEDAIVARQSGDEFIIYVPARVTRKEKQAWVERLVTRVRQPVVFSGMEFALSCSVGIAPIPDKDDISVEDMIRQADLAMYQAKRTGKNRYSFFQTSYLEESRYTARLAAELKQLKMEEELSLAFQPRMFLHNRELAGAEVLVRWRRPDGEVIPPNDFIPVAEETGQILRIGYWVFEKSCEQLQQWSNTLDGLVLSVNLSARQLFDEHLVERIETIRERYGLGAAQLEFEVTESSAMQDIDHAVRILGRLRALGYGLSLDDFGTGFSSLSHMRTMPVNTIKIDRSFILGMGENRQERVMVAGIVELATHLDKQVLAEGVETQAQLDMLESLGCDEAQGFLIGRPMPSSEFEQLMNNWPFSHP